MNGRGRERIISVQQPRMYEQSPQPDQNKNGERAEQPKQREKPEKASRTDEAQRWVHGESLKMRMTTQR
jgi:hypothetical protein